MKRAIPLPLVRTYEACSNNDYLFLNGDMSLDKCPKCQATRNASSRETKQRTVKMMSIADKMAELLACDDFREGMEVYSSTVKNNNRIQQTEGVKVFRDVFDGQIYQDLIKDGKIDSNFNVVIKLDVDGFTCASSRSSMTMVNAVILSLDPSER